MTLQSQPTFSRIESALALLDRLMARRMRVRLVGVGLSALVPLEEHQGDLFAEGEFARWKRFYRGLDKLRDRFGFGIVRVGPSLRLKDDEAPGDAEK